MRRLPRWCFNGLCLVSLLVCLGTGWLWWRGSRSGKAGVEVSLLHTDVQVYSHEGGFEIQVIRGWPCPAGAWAGEGGSAPVLPVWQPLSRGGRLDGSGYGTICGIPVARGPVSVDLQPDNSPVRLTYHFGLTPVRTSDLLPAWSAGRIPRPLASAFFALPPVSWLAFRARLILRRRRRPLGGCIRCGYDLTGNTTGVCSECGTAVEARRVTA